MAIYHENNIREYRERSGLTQQQLGSLIGVDGSQISKYESGEHMPPADKLVKMAYALHTPAEELWKGRRLNDAGIPLLDISGGQVARRQLFSRVNDDCITISLDGVQFSTACVRKWEDTEYIQLIPIEEEGIIVIRKSSEDDLDSQRWSRMKDGRKYARKITGRGFSKLIYEMMNWSKGYKFKISGYPAVNEADPDEQLWFFELKEAEGIPLSSRAREKCGVRDEDIEVNVLNALTEIEEKKQIESERRKKLREEGKDPGPAEQYICFPDEWGQYRFGLPCEVHGVKPKIALDDYGGSG